MEWIADLVGRLKSDFRRAMVDSKKALASRQSRAHKLSLKSDLEPNSSTDETTRDGEAKNAAQLGIGWVNQCSREMNNWRTDALRAMAAVTMNCRPRRMKWLSPYGERPLSCRLNSNALFYPFRSSVHPSLILIHELRRIDWLLTLK